MEPLYKQALLFGGEPVLESEKSRVMEEISKVGGSLTFTIHYSPEGWTATCTEIPSIIAGNTNPKPSDIEIQSEIRSAIFATFNVQLKQPDIQSPLSTSFRYSLIEG